MRRITVLLLASALSAAVAVAAQGPSAQAGPAVPALSAPIALPSAVPEKFTRNVFAGDKVRQRIFVPSYRVSFMVSSSASARTNSDRAQVMTMLAGAEPALIQAITDRAYADFIERLTAAGFTVVQNGQARFLRRDGTEIQSAQTTSPRAAPPATPGASAQVIRPGEVVEGEVRPGASSGAELQFDALIGERYSVAVEPLDPGFDPAVTVRGPDGRRHNGSNITQSNRTARIVFTASATGLHQILPKPEKEYRGAESAGRFRVRLARHTMQNCPDDSSYHQAAAPDLRFGSGGTIGIGEQVCGNLAPGDTPMMGAGTPWVDRWQVTLQPGQAVGVAASSQNLSTPVQWRIVAPANTPEPIVEPQPLDWLKVTARAAGRYTIEVYTEVPMVTDYVLDVTPVNN